MSTLKVNDIEEATSGGGKIAVARAWVFLKNTGTFTVNDSFNVSSVTDNAGGDQTANWSNNMSNTYYVASGSTAYGQNNSAANGRYIAPYSTDNFTTSRLRFQSVYSYNVGGQDMDKVNVIIFGDLA